MSVCDKNLSPGNHPEENAPRRLGQRLCSIKQAAVYLGLSPWTVREAIWRGDLPCVRLGRRVLIDIQDLEAFVERNKRKEAS